MTKHQRITALYHDTIKAVTAAPAAWTAFLETASRNFKCSFDEQILIHAQRPDAVAVLEIERWNRRFGRWVNRGSKGIAVFDPQGNSPTRLKHYFDISDTHEGRGARPVPLWQMESRFEGDVIETLQNSFGELANSETLADALISAAKNIVEDNLPDYLTQLASLHTDSFLEELDDLNLQVRYRTVMQNSVAYMLLYRCGIDPRGHLEVEDFEWVSEFNTPQTATALGLATSAIAEACLREISATVLDLGNRTFAEPERIADNESKTIERGVSHEPDLSARERLSSPEPDTARRTDPADEVGTDAAAVPERAPSDPVHAPDDQLHPQSTSGGNRADGDGADRAALPPDGAGRGRDGADEGHRPDDVGGPDEQHPPESGRTGDERPRVRIKPLPTEQEQQQNLFGEATEELSVASSLPVPLRTIDAELLRGDGPLSPKLGTYHHFQSNPTDDEAIKHLKSRFGSGGHSAFPGHDFRVSGENKGITFSKGDHLNPEVKYTLSWTKVLARIKELLTADRFLTSQEKDEFYPQYLEHLNQREITRQKEQYLDDMAKLPPAEKRATLPARLADFIDLAERYLIRKLAEHGFSEISDTASTEQVTTILRNPQKTEQFAAAMNAIGGGATGIFERNHGYRFAEELRELHPRHLVYEIGDTVSLDGHEYEVRSFDDATVRLVDRDFPLMETEVLRDEFERKAAEDSANEPLMRMVQAVPAERVEPAAESEPDLPIIAEPAPQVEAEPYISRRGDQYEIDGKIFEVVRYSEGSSYADLQEITDTGYPIGRSESVEFLQTLEPIHTVELAEPEQGPTADYDLSYRYVNDRLLVFNDAAELEEDFLLSVVARVEPDGTIAILDENLPERERHAIRHVAETELDRYKAEAEASLQQMVDVAERVNAEWEAQNQDSRTEIIDRTVIETPLYDVEFVKHRIPQPEPLPPTPDRHNYRITDDTQGHGGAKTKFRNNVTAIETLRKIESENRGATPAEQEILAQYVGWGGLPQTFDPDHAAWVNEYRELHALLSPEEYTSARESTLNAHYTSPTVIKAIYKAVENMGFTSGNILEPSCGVGNFFGLLPESMSGSRLFGVELDSVSGRIAQQLYPNADIAVQGFETTQTPDNFFDLAIGNVPFGGYKLSEKRYDKHNFNIHDHFFAKSLDKVRPGGIIAFVTSKGTLDKKNSDVRRYIAQRAELLGAIRLPNTAFKQNAGTEVTSDIIFLQKRDRMTAIEPDWVHLGQTEDGIPVNSYFVENPDMMLGTMSIDSGMRMYGNENTAACIPIEGADLDEQLEAAIVNIHAEITDYERDEDELEADTSIPADPTVRNFSYALVNDKLYYRQDSRMTPVDVPVTTENRIKGLIELRECARRLITLQSENYSDHEIAAEQARLNGLYDRYTQQYGLLHSRGNSMAFAQDSAYALLCSLEVLDENGELERKAEMFSKRTIRPHTEITHVDTASEALMVSLSEKAKVDLPFMAGLCGMTEEEVLEKLEGVVFLNVGSADSQDKTYVTADEYLSGNVREKLAQAKAGAKAVPGLSVNVRALESVMPKDLTAADISVRLGATWLPIDVVEEFMYDLLEPAGYVQHRVRVDYTEYTGEWAVTNKNYDRGNIHAHSTYGTGRANAYKIIEDTLNLRDVRVWDSVEDAHGNKTRVLNRKETAIAQSKQEIIRAKFNDWIWADPDRRERLTRLYNDKFNSIRPREYDGAHLTFPGMNPEIKLHKHQVDAIARILYGGNTLLAHCVGAGKTYEMVAAAMESKRVGLSNKNLIVVPNHLTEQWAAEFLQLYPSANVLVTTKKDFERRKRKKFCARIATGDYDAVIMGHSQFEKIPVSIKRQEDMIEKQIDEITSAIRTLKANRAERYTVKQMEKVKKNLETRLKKLFDTSRKDDVLDFEELGVDRLFVDEAHYYKNLFFTTKMRNVGGIAQVEAQKSSDLFMKCRYLDELKGGRSTVFATGTPISNSMVELYTMQRYLQYRELESRGLHHFDSWASTFGETVTAIELAPEGVRC